jgi:hypothetical protein
MRKHLICNHCGGRFGTVTHRWCGNKFCGRACKNAYRHKNRHTLLGWVTLRFFTFARGACLAVAVAVAVLTLLLAPANAVPGVEQPAAGASFEFNKEDGTLYIDWSGPIVAGMADDLRTTLDKYGTVLDRVVLFLDSAGGQVEEGDRVIAVLNEIKLRHQLITVVPHGKLCASMCIPIFLQGEDRLAARRAANRHGRDVAVVPQILRPRRGLNALAQKYRAHDQGSRPVANRRRSHQHEEWHHLASAGGPDTAGRSVSAGRRGPWP